MYVHMYVCTYVCMYVCKVMNIWNHYYVVYNGFKV